jgi:hypothetical protein
MSLVACSQRKPPWSGSNIKFRSQAAASGAAKIILAVIHTSRCRRRAPLSREKVCDPFPEHGHIYGLPMISGPHGWPASGSTRGPVNHQRSCRCGVRAAIDDPDASSFSVSAHSREFWGHHPIGVTNTPHVLSDILT